VPELTERLQAVLGPAYRVEKELGGGGMSRVFLAEEVDLGRRVVVKVLPPDMAAGVNVERFRREIQLAAKLQHPHIVPLLSAGASGDLLYYVMPFIEGESLRAKLAREGELPVAEALRILRDVVDALSYAHGHHVVHRDIKPDNVLLSGKHALVTDFGVAKAVAESTGKHTLTSMGVALGTPAYMAPEQATADPHTDHRADIYALGALAYEMLSGRPPFMAMNAQAMLAAHVTEAPEPVTKHRTTVPEPLNQLILRCLEKKPADRWQRAEELLPHLEAILTPTGGITPTGTQPVISSGTQAAIERAHPVRVAALFALASVGVLAIVYAAVQLMGLPDWVFYGAIGLLAVGLPIMLLTSHHERRRALARSSGRLTATPAGGLTPHFTWRKALMGGAAAFAGLGVVAAGYMAMRALGIGPMGSLIASGALREQERLIVAEFENGTQDSALGRTVTDLVRVALGQSRVVSVMEPTQVSDVLERMRRRRNTPVTPEVAGEVVAREGVKAFVAGEIRPLGAGYVISARMVAAGTGDALVVLREEAPGAEGLIAAIDRLSDKLRERIGESLRTVRADPPLERLTTTSLEALRLYAQADRVQQEGDVDRAIALLEEAVKHDTLFAMAYRRMGTLMTNTGFVGLLGERGRAALRRAYELRDRLSDVERYFVEAMYASRVENDGEKAVTAYLAILEKHPNNGTALNNLGIQYAFLGRVAERDAVLRRAVQAGVAISLTYGNLVFFLRGRGQLAAADTILQLFAERFPANPNVVEQRSTLAAVRMDFDGSAEAARDLLSGRPAQQVFAHNRLAAIAQVRGELTEANRRRDQAQRIDAQRAGMAPEERDMLIELGRAERAAWFGTGGRAAAARLEVLWQSNRRLTAPRGPQERRYPRFITDLAQAGRPAAARRVLEEYRGSLDQRQREDWFQRNELRVLEGQVRVAEGRASDAVGQYRLAREEIKDGCSICFLADMAYAFDQAGLADSAIAYYREYLETPGDRFGDDQVWLAPALRRLGELYEGKGDREQAVEHYGRFVELWKGADPELQPMVSEVKQRMARLAGERPR